MSPFGARGANSGVQDADNLAWKLAARAQGEAPDALLDSYDAEREYAADENILNSTRSTDFITPKSEISRVRSATRRCSSRKEHPFARRLVNSGRLSVPAVLCDSPLNTPDTDAFAGAMVPGAPCTDAPVRVDGDDGWLLEPCRRRTSRRATSPRTARSGRCSDRSAAGRPAAASSRWSSCSRGRDAASRYPGIDVVEDSDGLLAKRFDARPGTFYLLRPDQHVCARWRSFDANARSAPPSPARPAIA